MKQLLFVIHNGGKGIYLSIHEGGFSLNDDIFEELDNVVNSPIKHGYNNAVIVYAVPPTTVASYDSKSLIYDFARPAVEWTLEAVNEHGCPHWYDSEHISLLVMSAIEEWQSTHVLQNVSDIEITERGAYYLINCERVIFKNPVNIYALECRDCEFKVCTTVHIVNSVVGCVNSVVKNDEIDYSSYAVFTEGFAEVRAQSVTVDSYDYTKIDAYACSLYGNGSSVLYAHEGCEVELYEQSSCYVSAPDVEIILSDNSIAYVPNEFKEFVNIEVRSKNAQIAYI